MTTRKAPRRTKRVEQLDMFGGAATSARIKRDVTPRWEQWGKNIGMMEYYAKYQVS